MTRIGELRSGSLRQSMSRRRSLPFRSPLIEVVGHILNSPVLFGKWRVPYRSQMLATSKFLQNYLTDARPSYVRRQISNRCPFGIRPACSRLSVALVKGMIPPLSSFPEHETARLRLRPLTSPDAEALRLLTDDPAITDNIDFLSYPFSILDAEALIARNDEENCFIAVLKGKNIVGVIGAHTRGNAQLEIGYWMGSAYHGRGYATEAIAGVISQLQLLYCQCQITAECRIENQASWHLLSKLGFQPTGTTGKRAGRALLAISSA